MKLDPLLAPAMELEKLPIVSGRGDMITVALNLETALVRIIEKAQREGDPQAALQLTNVANALSAMVISLVAYTRGKSPRLASRAPDSNIIVS